LQIKISNRSACNDTKQELTFDSKKRCLKIPEGLSEVVNQRTDNSMAKRKRTKGQTMIWKTLHRKLKTINNQGYYGRVSGSCFTIGTRHVTLVTNLVISHE
jgi:hypothetical protein